MNKKIILIGFINCIILAVVALFFIKRGNQESYTPIVLQSSPPQGGDGWKLLDKSLPLVPDGAFEESLINHVEIMANLPQEYSITDLARWGEKIVLADSAQGKLLVFNQGGELLCEIKGYEGQRFKVPSPYFSISVSKEGELWVTDPGRKCLVQFDTDGQYKAQWHPQDEQAFLGCCNPARMRCLEGGRFATLEKGHVRVRIFSPSGAVESTVADFGIQQNINYDMTVQDERNIIIIDGNKQQILFYQKN